MSNPKQQASKPAADVNAAVNAAPDAPALEQHAPQTPAPDGAPVNRFRAMFEAVTFEPKDGTVYTNRDGSKSKQVAAGVAIFTGAFGGNPVIVTARQRSGGKPYVDVNFIASRTGGASIKAFDARAEEELSACKAWLAEEYKLWRGQAGAGATTKRANTGIEIEGLAIE